MSKDDKIIDEAKKRFEFVQDYESNARQLALEDTRFAEGDSDNNYQWPDTLYATRQTDGRPCLTLNILRQHNLQVINDAKQNTPGISIRATGDKATKEAADVYEGLVRYIERQSMAQAIYNKATETQVKAGLGVWRVVTEYISDDSFDQDIYIKLINDPLSVYFDPDCKEPDKSDMKYCFIFDNVPRDEFNKSYPKFKREPPGPALNNEDDWDTENYVRVAEYFRRKQVEDELVSYVIPETGERAFIKMSDLRKQNDEEAVKAILDDPETKTRESTTWQVEWFKLAGDEIIDRREFPNRQYIPIVPLVGEEVVIDNTYDRKGHTRAMKDAQRMYNYNASGSVEFGALQTKAPWIGPARAIEGLETYWANMNTTNPAMIPYNDTDDSGQPIAPPQRVDPPQISSFFQQAMENSANDLQLVSGQFQAQMGEPSNERSGIAINERKKQGDNATYHYADQLYNAITFTGKILLETIPDVYDTPRVMHILSEDGAETEVQLDPQAAQAHQEMLKRNSQEVEQIIFNPNVGKYAVEADTGPAYATQRQQAFDVYSQIIVSKPELLPLIGDIVFSNLDAPGAEEIAERFKNMIPPQALGQHGPNPQMVAQQQQMQKLQHMLQELAQRNYMLEIANKGKDEKREIDVYGAQTDRLKVMLDHMSKTKLSEKDMAQLWHEWSLQDRGAQIDNISAVNSHAINMDAQAQDQQFQQQMAQQAQQNSPQQGQ
jgi:hypothetical protein